MAVVIVLATISFFGASAPSSAAGTADPGTLRVVSVDMDAQQNVNLVVQLGSDTSAADPTPAFSVSPRSIADPLRVTRLGARGVDLMLVFEAATPATILRGVRTAAAEALLTLPPGARVGVAGTAGRDGGSMSTDTATALLALDRVRTDRSTHELLAEAVDLFQRSPRVAGRHRAVVLFDVRPYPESSLAVLNLGAKAAASGVAVYVVRFVDRRVLHPALEEMAVRTGGLVSATDDPTRLAAAYHRVLADLESRYQLRFHLRDRSPEEVRVTVEQRGMTRSTVVPLPSTAERARGLHFTPTSVTLVVVFGLLVLTSLVLFTRLRESLRRTVDRERQPGSAQPPKP